MVNFKSLFLLLLVLLPSVVLAKFVAVLETVADPAASEAVSSSDRLYLTDNLRSEAVKVLPAEQNFTIMTRENISAMLPPGKSIEECEGECLAETGRNIAADYVAQARVGLFDGSLTLSVEIYETAGNKLVASFNGDGETVRDLLEIIKREAPEFFKKVKSGSFGFAGQGGIGSVSSGGAFSFKGSQKFIVEIVTNPAGAVPTVDGKAFPKCVSTPCKVQIEAGEHRFLASMERYLDAEAVVAVTANNQQIVLDLEPNFGYFNLRPGLLKSIGRSRELKMTIDGNPAKYGMTELDPGEHTVSIRHPCYDPVDFNVIIERQKSETFNERLTPGIGGLVLDAEWNGEPQAVPVYINREEVGSTPFEGEVPVCAEVSVGDPGKKEIVAVDLLWHEIVNVTHRLKYKPAAVAMAEEVERQAREKKAAEEKVRLDSIAAEKARQKAVEQARRDSIAAENSRLKAENAYAELDGEDSPRVGMSIPAEVETEKSEEHGIHWLPVGISAVVAATGTVLAVVGNADAKEASKRSIRSEGDYKKNKDDAHSGQTLRTVGIVTAIVGAIGLGVSFAF